MQDASSERAHELPVQLEVEPAPAPAEVLVELAQDEIEWVAGLHDAGRDALREALEHRILVFLGERDPHQAPSGGGDQQPAERRVGRGVADVGKPFLGDAPSQAVGGVRGRALAPALAVVTGGATLRATRGAAQRLLDPPRLRRGLFSVG